MSYKNYPRVPQSRDGQFSTELFSRYQHSEQVLVLAMIALVLQGVSTRRVEKITEELCGAHFSKSTVSLLCTQHDAGEFGNGIHWTSLFAGLRPEADSASSQMDWRARWARRCGVFNENPESDGK